MVDKMDLNKKVVLLSEYAFELGERVSLVFLFIGLSIIDFIDGDKSIEAMA